MNAVTSQAQPSPPRRVRIDGKRSVLMRPVEASDAAGLSDFYARLSCESSRRRFLSCGNPPRSAVVRAFTEHEGEGFVGILNAPGAKDGAVVAHVSLQPDGPDSAEIAFAVADDLQRHGLGSALMETAVKHAQRLGLRRLSATMFADNTPMQRLMRGAGCSIALDQIDAGTEEIALAICSLPALSPPLASRQPTPAMTAMSLWTSR